MKQPEVERITAARAKVKSRPGAEDLVRGRLEGESRPTCCAAGRRSSASRRNRISAIHGQSRMQCRGAEPACKLPEGEA
eukprot:3431043-Alexandrium_andersonii.AAC.1